MELCISERVVVSWSCLLGCRLNVGCRDSQCNAGRFVLRASITQIIVNIIVVVNMRVFTSTLLCVSNHLQHIILR